MGSGGPLRIRWLFSCLLWKLDLWHLRSITLLLSGMCCLLMGGILLTAILISKSGVGW